MHITFRSSVIRSGMSGSGHSKPIIIGLNTVVRCDHHRTDRNAQACARNFVSPQTPRQLKKNLHVRNARHTWLKVETTSPFLPLPLTNMPLADTLYRQRKDFSKVVSRQRVHIFHKMYI